MKKTSILYILLLLLSVPAMAQKGWHVGLIGGGGLTFIANGQDYSEGRNYDYNPKAGYMGGLALGGNFTNHFGFQTEVTAARKGQRFEGNGTALNTSRNISLNYVQIPLLLKYSGGNRNNRFVIMAGPQWGYLNKATMAEKTDGMPAVTTDIRNRFRSNDIAGVLDIGSEFTLKGNWFMSSGLRFNYSLRDINEPSYRRNPSNSLFDISSNANVSFNLGLHYQLCSGICLAQ